MAKVSSWKGAGYFLVEVEVEVKGEGFRGSGVKDLGRPEGPGRESAQLMRAWAGFLQKKMGEPCRGGMFFPLGLRPYKAGNVKILVGCGRGNRTI